MSGCMTSSIPPPPTGSWTPSLGTLDSSNAGDPTPQHARTDAPQESDISSLSYLLTMSTTSSHTEWIQFLIVGSAMDDMENLSKVSSACLTASGEAPVLSSIVRKPNPSLQSHLNTLFLWMSYKNIKYVNYFSVTLNRHKTNLNSKLEIFSELKIRK
jgi:hypothetical protein